MSAEDSILKRCSKCGEHKPRSEFHKSANGRAKSHDGLHSYCKRCKAAYGKARYKAGGERWYGEHTARRYNLSPSEYEAILKSQGGVCAICERVPGRDRRVLHVDHDHKTGVVRGIVCFTCNAGMGQFGDDPALLARAIDYLLRF